MLPPHTLTPEKFESRPQRRGITARRSIAAASRCAPLVMGRAVRRLIHRIPQIDAQFPQSSSVLSRRGSLESVRQTPDTYLHLLLVGFWAFWGSLSKYSRQQLFRSLVAPVRVISQLEYCLLAREFSGGRPFVRFQSS
jgi:hypothetical protein